MITKVGPPERSDLPKRRTWWRRALRWLYVLSGLMFISRMFMFYTPRGLKRTWDATINEPNVDEAHYEAPAGIPEADLTERERKQAAERMRWHEEQR